MFDLVHQMRTRIVTSPAFDGAKILAAILFEQTMERTIAGLPTGDYLWERKAVVPFVKVDQGLAEAADGVQLMKPLTGLDALLDQAVEHRMFGTKMRSLVRGRRPRASARWSTSSSTSDAASPSATWCRSWSPRSPSTPPTRRTPRSC